MQPSPPDRGSPGATGRPGLAVPGQGRLGVPLPAGGRACSHCQEAGPAQGQQARKGFQVPLAKREQLAEGFRLMPTFTT